MLKQKDFIRNNDKLAQDIERFSNHQAKIFDHIRNKMPKKQRPSTAKVTRLSKPSTEYPIVIEQDEVSDGNRQDNVSPFGKVFNDAKIYEDQTETINNHRFSVSKSRSRSKSKKKFTVKNTKSMSRERPRSAYPIQQQPEMQQTINLNNLIASSTKNL
jgi:hypothetical protein